MELKFRIDMTGRILEKLGSRAVPWAAKYALDETAVQLRDVTVMRLYTQFKIRTGWVPGSIRSRASNTKNLTSAVWVMDKSARFMARHAEGGDKPATSAKGQGVPQKGAEQKGIGMPRGPEGMQTTMARRNWPGTMLAKLQTALDRQLLAKMGPFQAGKKRRKSRSKVIRGGVFVIDKPDVAAIMQRLEPGRGTGKLRVLWFMVKGPVRVKQDWDFYEYGQKFVPTVFPRLFDMAMATELANLRP